MQERPLGSTARPFARQLSRAVRLHSRCRACGRHDDPGAERASELYRHDPKRMSFEEAVAPGGAVEALTDLRDEGVIAHLGVAGGPIDLLPLAAVALQLSVREARIAATIVG